MKPTAELRGLATALLIVATGCPGADHTVAAQSVATAPASARRGADALRPVAVAAALSLGAVSPPAAELLGRSDIERPEWSEPAPVSAAGKSEYGSFPLAMGQMLLGNLIPWFGAEYLAEYKDIARISPTTWKDNVLTGPVWDDNHFYINWALHPYQGNYYFLAGRSNGFSFEQSYLFTLLGSALWECCGESHKASASDLITTTLGGMAVGETFYRLGSQALLTDNRVYHAIAYLLTPTRGVTHALLGKPDPPPSHPEIWLEPSREAPVLIASGWSSLDGPFVTAGAVWDDPTQLGWRSRPFSHFEANLEVTPWGKNWFGRLQFRGNLWPLPSYRTQRLYVGATLVQAMDYLNNEAFEFGGDAVGLAGLIAWGDPWARHFAISVDAHSFFGGIQSEGGHLGEPHDNRDKERDREYDFTAGWGFQTGVTVRPWRMLRIRGFYRQNHHHVLHGSNADGNPAIHETKIGGIEIRGIRLCENLGLAGDFQFFRRTSDFSHPELDPVVKQSANRFRVYLTLDTTPVPLTLFAF